MNARTAAADPGAPLFPETANLDAFGADTALQQCWLAVCKAVFSAYPDVRARVGPAVQQGLLTSGAVGLGTGWLQLAATAAFTVLPPASVAASFASPGDVVARFAACGCTHPSQLADAAFRILTGAYPWLSTNESLASANFEVVTATMGAAGVRMPPFVPQRMTDTALGVLCPRMQAPDFTGSSSVRKTRRLFYLAVLAASEELVVHLQGQGRGQGLAGVANAGEGTIPRQLGALPPLAFPQQRHHAGFVQQRVPPPPHQLAQPAPAQQALHPHPHSAADASSSSSSSRGSTSAAPFSSTAAGGASGQAGAGAARANDAGPTATAPASPAIEVIEISSGDDYEDGDGYGGHGDGGGNDAGVMEEEEEEEEVKEVEGGSAGRRRRVAAPAARRPLMLPKRRKQSALEKSMEEKDRFLGDDKDEFGRRMSQAEREERDAAAASAAASSSKRPLATTARQKEALAAAAGGAYRGSSSLFPHGQGLCGPACQCQTFLSRPFAAPSSVFLLRNLDGSLSTLGRDQLNRDGFIVLDMGLIPSATMVTAMRAVTDAAVLQSVQPHVGGILFNNTTIMAPNLQKGRAQVSIERLLKQQPKHAAADTCATLLPMCHALYGVLTYLLPHHRPNNAVVLRSTPDCVAQLPHGDYRVDFNGAPFERTALAAIYAVEHGTRLLVWRGSTRLYGDVIAAGEYEDEGEAGGRYYDMNGYGGGEGGRDPAAVAVALRKREERKREAEASLARHQQARTPPIFMEVIFFFLASRGGVHFFTRCVHSGVISL